MKKTYTNIVNEGLILSKKEKYTKKDVDSVLINHMFLGLPCSKDYAVFIVKCSAVYHGTNWSKYISSC